MAGMSGKDCIAALPKFLAIGRQFLALVSIPAQRLVCANTNGAGHVSAADTGWPA